MYKSEEWKEGWMIIRWHPIHILSPCALMKICGIDASTTGDTLVMYTTVDEHPFCSSWRPRGRKRLRDATGCYRKLDQTRR